MDRQIICGEIEETFTDTPIEIFKKAVQLSAIENWIVKYSDGNISVYKDSLMKRYKKVNK